MASYKFPLSCSSKELHTSKLHDTVNSQVQWVAECYYKQRAEKINKVRDKGFSALPSFHHL